MRYIFIAVLGIFLLSGCSLLGGSQTTPENSENNSGDVMVSEQDKQEEDTNNNMEEEKPGEVEQATFSMEEVAKHNSAEDCWLLIEGKVYDVTGFIASGNHGGGDAIIEGCGIDSTELYNTRPMGSGTPHSDKARSFLPNFYIGDLEE